MEAGDAFDRIVDRGDHLGRDLVRGRGEIGRRRRQRVGRDRRLVELAGEAGQRRVALDPHRLQDRPHLVDEGPEVGLGTRQQRVAAGAIQAGEVVKADGSGHGGSFRPGLT